MPKDDKTADGIVQDVDLRDAKGGTEIAPASIAVAAGRQNEAPAGGSLTRMMALPEPQRTEALERAVQAGLVFNLRSRTGKAERVLYGDFALEVPPDAVGKPFTAGHAIHLLWTAPKLVEEVEG